MVRPRGVEADPLSGGFAVPPAQLRSAVLVSAMTTAHRLFATRPRSGWLVDAAIAAAALAGSLALISHGGVPGSTPDELVRIRDHREALTDLTDLDSLGVVLSILASAPLVVWRLSPIGVFVVTAAASALLVGLGYPLGIPLGASAALYLLAASRDEEDPWTRWTTAAVLLLFGAYAMAAGVGKGSFPTGGLLHGGIAFALAWFAGDRTRLRREHIAELRERAARAERDAGHERRLAVAEERARIARDLHDAAGHAANVIAVRAGAARMRRDPERSQAALEMIEEIARQTAAEIDGIVGSLRDPSCTNGAADAPLGLASLDTMIARHSAAGLEVTVATQGVSQPLESAPDQAAYRILQEALTNAARHGSGTAEVEVEFGETAVELEITNPTQHQQSPRPNGGHGLIGMRERATLLGGSFSAEGTNGKFRVHARLPYGGPSA
jgi:signal transduction histidine kinase